MGYTQRQDLGFCCKGNSETQRRVDMCAVDMRRGGIASAGPLFPPSKPGKGLGPFRAEGLGFRV